MKWRVTEMADTYGVDKFLHENLLDSNRHNIGRLVKYIKKKECAFILGAGVCMSAGLPGWNGLLGELFLATAPLLTKMDDDTRKEVREYIKNLGSPKIMENINPLEQGEYLSILLDWFWRNEIRGALEKRDARKNGRLVVAAVSEALKAYYCNPKTEHNWELLYNLAAFIKDGDVRQIVNYNFDDLLECALLREKNMDSSEFISVGLDECIYDNSSKRPMIYHVHGRVPVLMEGKDEYYKAGLIFDESSYMSMEQSIYNNSNICQSQVLRSHHALFMGVSLQDASMRRIIFRGMNPPEEISDVIDEQIRKFEFFLPDNFSSDTFYEHYFLFGIDDLVRELQIPKEAGALEEKHVVLIYMFLRLQAMYLMKRGVFPIFCTHDDIPVFLKNIKPKRRHRS